MVSDIDEEIDLVFDNNILKKTQIIEEVGLKDGDKLLLVINVKKILKFKIKSPGRRVYMLSSMFYIRGRPLMI